MIMEGQCAGRWALGERRRAATAAAAAAAAAADTTLAEHQKYTSL